MEAARRRDSLAGAGVAALALLALILRSPLLLLVALLVGALALAVALWGHYALVRLDYERAFDCDRCFVGEAVGLRVSVTNRKPLPLTFLLVDESVPGPLEIKSRSLQFQRRGRSTMRQPFGLSWYQQVVRHYTVIPTRRGIYRLGRAEIHGGDPFGWADRRLTVGETAPLIVYPRIVPLDRVGLPTKRPFGDLRSQDRLFSDPLRIAGVREYRPGDPLNRVHWKASAAAGQLQVKQYDPSTNPGLAIFLNTWSFGHFWEGDDVAALEAGCTLAASVVNWAAENGFAAGLYANGMTQGWGMSLRLPPARGAQVLPQALEGLARLQTGSPLPIHQMLLDEAPGLSYGTSLVIITRQVSDDLAAALYTLRRAGRPITLVVTGPDPVPELPGVRLYTVSGEGELHAAVLAP